MVDEANGNIRVFYISPFTKGGDFMEKKQSFTYQELASTIVKAVRGRAATIPAFRDSHNGCIRITMVPLCKDADVWLGGMSNYQTWLNGEEQDVCEREFVYKIDPRGSHTIQYVCEDGHTEPVNCYGYSALKTAWASWKRKFDDAVRKGLGETFSDFQFRQHTQFFTEENGWSMQSGSVYATISVAEVDFIRLYVCTSGAKSDEDEQCSLYGMLAAQEYCKANLKSLNFTPDFKSAYDDC